MKLVIFGSTGGTGRQLVAQALEQGHTVTALARDPKKLTQQHERLQVVKGNVLDFAIVEQVLQEQDAVLCALGMPASNKDYLRASGTKNIIHAMEKVGIKQLICQSAFGCGDSQPLLPFHYKYIIIPLFLRHVYADHEMQEKYIKASQLDWVIVRPPELTDGKHTGRYWHGATTVNKSITYKISRADVADFMLKQLIDDTYLRKTPSVSYTKA